MTSWDSYFSTYRKPYEIKLLPYQHGFTCNGLRLKGITNDLRECFYSNYIYQQNSRKRSITSSKDEFQFGRNPTIHSLSQGVSRGTEVHQEIADYINEFCKGLNERFIHRHDSLHRYTLFALLGLQKNKFYPFKAELCVGDVESRRATPIDCLFQNEEGQLGIIEWKTGSNGCFKKFNGFLTMTNHQTIVDIFGDGFMPDNSPYNQAQLQLTITIVLLEKMYNVIPELRYIINISESGFDPYKLQPEFFERRYHLWNYFKQYVHTKTPSPPLSLAIPIAPAPSLFFQRTTTTTTNAKLSTNSKGRNNYPDRGSSTFSEINRKTTTERRRTGRRTAEKRTV